MGTPMNSQIFAQIAQQAQMQREAEERRKAEEEQTAMQIMQALREQYAPKKEEALGQVRGQFDPIIEQLLLQAQKSAPKEEKPNKWADLSSIIGNAFYTSKFGKEVPTPMERRRSEAMQDSQMQQNALAQLRLMMEGKSKAEDRITDNFNQELSAQYKLLTEAEKAKFAREKWGVSKDQADRRIQIAEDNLGLSGLRTKATLERLSTDPQQIAKQEAVAELARRQGIPEDQVNIASSEFRELYGNKLGELKRASGTGTSVTSSGVDVLGREVKSTAKIPPAPLNWGGKGRAPKTPEQLPVDTSQYGKPTQKVPTMAPTPIVAPSVQKPIDVSQVPNTPAKASDFWKAPNGAGISNVPSIKRNVEGMVWKSPTMSKEFFAMESGSTTIAQALQMFNKIRSSPEKRTLLDPNSAAMQAENAAASFSQMPGISAITGEYQTGSGFSKYKRGAQMFGGGPDTDLDMFATFVAKNMNQAIKNITGAAASNPEFARIAIQEPQLGELPETYATKAVSALLLATYKSARSGIYTDTQGRRIIPELMNSDPSRYIQEFSSFLGKALAAGTLSDKVVEQLLQPETLAKAQFAYAQAFASGGPEAAEKVLQGLKDSISSRMVFSRMQEANPGKYNKRGDF